MKRALFLSASVLAGTAWAASSLPERLGRQFTFALQSKPGAGGEARLYFCAQSRRDAYALVASPKQVSLVKLAAGKERALAGPRAWSWPARAEVVVQRRLDRIAAFINGRFALEASDAAYHGPKAAVLAKGAGRAGRVLRVQTLGKIVFDDDFMRAEAAGEWRPVRGQWEVCAMRVQSRSANPFSLFARFPRTERFRALYRGRTRRFKGLGLRVRYAAAGLEVTHVFPDTPAERADIRKGDVITAIDGRPVLSMSRREIVTRLLLPKDPKRRVVRAAGPRHGRWVERSLNLRPELIDLDRIDQDVVLPGSRLGPEAIAVAGHAFWSDLVFEASTKSAGRGAMGLVFGWRGAAEYWRVEWTGASPAQPAPANALRLVRVARGTERVVASKPVGFKKQTFYRLRALVGLRRIAFDIDDNRVLDYRLPPGDGVSPGRIGVYARDSNGVYFDDVRVRSIEEAPLPPEPDTPPPVFETDAMMRKWAGNPAWEWQAYEGGEFWRQFPTIGDARVTAPLPKGDKPFQIVVAAAERRAAAGYALTCDPGERALELSRLGRVVAKGRLPKGAKSLTLERAGAVVSAAADGRPLLTFRDPKPLAGFHGGLAGLPTPLARRARVVSRNLRDYFFRRAPADWDVVSGVWGTMNRWVCEPSWSWFGGRHPAMAAIQHKASFFGDMAVDVFCGPMMIAYWEGVHERFGDLCVTICSKSGALFDGYTVVFGGGRNTWTRLYRNGKIVAETRNRQFLLPKGYSRDEFDAHRDWFHISLRRIGSRVQLRLYDELALQFDDPHPLPGGRVTIWTCENGMLVSRARISAQRIEPKRLCACALTLYDDAALTNVVDHDAQTAVRRRGAAYELTNTVSGGPFVVALKPRRVDLAKRQVLRFQWRVLRGRPRVDLYFDFQGVRHRVVLAGPEKAEGVVTLGAFSAAPSKPKGWRAAAVGLFEMMRARYPRAKQLVIENPRLGNYSNENYLFAGLGGNGLGDAYALRGVKWTKRPAPGPLRVRRVEFPFEDPTNQSRVSFWLDGPAADFNSDGILARVRAAGMKPRVFRITDPALSYAAGAHRVDLDLERAGLSFAKPQTVRFELGRAGRAPDYAAEWRFDPTKDHVPPAVRISGSKRKPPIVADFEEDAAGVISVGLPNYIAGADAGALLYRDDSTRAAGRYSLRVANKKLGLNFGAGWMNDGFCFGRYRVLSFDYAIPPTTRDVTVSVLMRRQAQAITFSWSDGRWHHAEFDLFRLLRSRLPAWAEPRAEAIWIGDSRWYGWSGNYVGAAFHLDNLTLSPVLSKPDLDFAWSAWDVSGIAKTRTALNNSGDIASAARLQPGLAYFCAQARDRSGNESPAARFAFVYDPDPPEVLNHIRRGFDEQDRLVQIFEPNGVDARSIRLKVNGKEYRPDGRRVWYDQISGWLHFKPPASLSLPVRVELLSLRDYAGNALKPQAWTIEPPPPPKPPVRLTPAKPKKPAPKPAASGAASKPKAATKPKPKGDTKKRP